MVEGAHVVGRLLHQVAVHPGMVAHDDDGGVLIEGLLTAPGHKLANQPVGAAHHIGGGGAVIHVALLAHKAPQVVQIHREQGQVEGLLLRGQAGGLVPGNLKEAEVLIAPPDVVVLLDIALLPGGEQVEDLIAAVLGEVLAPPREGRVRSAEELLGIALLRQDVAQGGQPGREVFLDLHGVAVHGEGEGNARGLRQQGGHGPAGAAEVVQAAGGIFTGEVQVLLRQRRQAGHQVVLLPAALLLGEVGGFQALRHDVDQVALLLRGGDAHLLRIHILRLIDVRGVLQAEQVARHVELHVRVPAGENHQPRAQRRACPAQPGKQPLGKPPPAQRPQPPVQPVRREQEAYQHLPPQAPENRRQTAADDQLHHAVARALQRAQQRIQQLPEAHVVRPVIPGAQDDDRRRQAEDQPEKQIP